MMVETISTAPSPDAVVKYRFRPGFVVLSVFVSFFGAITFMELLHRQRKASGWHYWLQLTSTALPLGLVSIWCMHFVGNAAIQLGDGSRELQPIYNPLYSFISAVLPVITIVGMLYVAEKRHGGPRARIWSLLVAGIIAGFAIVGMHYVGNLGISNYAFHMNPVTFAGAVAIGCPAMTVVLFGIAKLQDALLNTFRWRLFCALIIAATVASLHFEASSHVSYTFKTLNTAGTVAQYQNVIVSTVLTVLTICLCVALAIYTRHERQQIRSKAEQVVLSCAWYDREGKVMVTRTGLLPSLPITDKDNERGFSDNFDTSHPAFQWIFKVTQNWTSVSRFVPGMKTHVNATAASNTRPGAADIDQMPRNSAAADQEYSLLFRKRFCTAALELASTLRVDLNGLGSLFEGVVNYSTFSYSSSPQSLFSTGNKLASASSLADLEACEGDFGRGQGLLLTKRVDRKDVPKFQTMDYRFLPIERVAAPLASSMQITSTQAHEYLMSVRQQTEPPKKQPPGTYLGVFALWPEVAEEMNKYGPKVIVQKDEQHRLPCVYLWGHEEHSKYQTWISELQGLCCGDILMHLQQRIIRLDESYAAFCRIFCGAIHELSAILNASFFADARLNTHTVRLPSEAVNNSKAYNSLISLCVIPDIHFTLRWSAHVKLIPYCFFRCLQQARQHLCDPEFIANVHQEFGMFSDDDILMSPSQSSLAQSMGRVFMLSSPVSSTRKLLSSQKWRPHTRRSEYSLDNLDKGVDTVPHGDGKGAISEGRDSGNGEGSFKKGPFGGVLVTRLVSVEDSPRYDDDLNPPVSPVGSVASTLPHSSCFRGEASSRSSESRVWVDELYDVTKQRWRSALVGNRDIQV